MTLRPAREQEFDYGLDPGERYEPVDDLDEPPFDLTQPHIMTVLGPIRPEEAGVALTHEHVIAMPPGHPNEAADPDLVLDDPHAALAELEDLYSAGGRTVVDATTAGYGRDIRALEWVAARAPVHLVAVTGHHNEAHSALRLAGKSIDEVAAICVTEVTEGIDGTGIRAGAIVAGANFNRISALEEVALRGAARANEATGAVIMAHCDRGTMAQEQLAILADEGVDPDRVILCHQDFQLDEGYLMSLLETGAWVSFDQVSKAKDAADSDRAAMIARLVQEGFGHRLLVSGDLDRRSSLRAYGGVPGLVYLMETFPLLLMEAGLSAPEVRTLLVDNPAAAFTIG
jgi:predicted metal-dependent phosphotriesterase family hydrolase